MPLKQGLSIENGYAGGHLSVHKGFQNSPVAPFLRRDISQPYGM